MGTLSGWVGLGAVILSIGVSLRPPEVEKPWVFEAKVLGGVIGFMLLGWVLAYLGSVRKPTAVGRSAGLP